MFGRGETTGADGGCRSRKGLVAATWNIHSLIEDTGVVRVCLAPLSSSSSVSTGNLTFSSKS